MSDELFPKGYKAVPDEQKTEEDWAIDERLSKFAQDAFNAHFYVCGKYLDAKLGGRQTSNDLHSLCQGYALASAEIESLSKRVAELEDALERIKNYHWGHCGTCKKPCKGFTDCDCEYPVWEEDDPCAIARSTLGER